MISRRTLLSGAALAVTGIALATPRRGTAGPVTLDEIGDRVQTVPKGQLPEFAELRDPSVRRAYQHAVHRGEDLDYIPCYCGCGRLGHRSNHDCYVKTAHRDGTLTFTSHAAT